VAPAWVAGLVVAAAVAAVPVAPRLGRSDAVRLLAYERAGLMSQALRLLKMAGVSLPGAARREVEASVFARESLGPGPRSAGADLVLITIDALRADHVSAYGYSRRTTPAIDAAAGRGVLFEHAYAAAPNSTYALTGALTGKHLYALAEARQVVGQRTLGDILGRAGYATAGFYSPPSELLLPPVFAELGGKKLVAAGTTRLMCDLDREFCQLYDLRTDPGERRSLDASPAAAEMHRHLAAWRAAYAPAALAAAARPGEPRRAAAADGDRAVGALMALLSSQDPARRADAARTLARLPADPQTRGALRQALADERTRPWAAVALARWCEEPALVHAAAVGTGSPELAARAGVALARCGRPAVPLLTAGLTAPDPSLRGEVMAALAAQRHGPARPLPDAQR
jgi:hypothetical protein